VTAFPRTRPDQCPGILRPWPAHDGALARIRLVGGRITARALAGLSAVAREYGDGSLHLTARANLQLRALPSAGNGALRDDVVAAIERLGLLPSRSHDLVRNVMVSPQTGLAAGRADLRPLATALDRALRADEALADLSAKFLFVLDDGRGDLADVRADLGLVALGADEAHLRVGDGWGGVVRLAEAVPRLLTLAHAFRAARGGGPSAAWHVGELAAPLVPAEEPQPEALVRSGPLPYGAVAGGRHVPAPDGVLSPALVAELVAGLMAGLRAGPPGERELVVTPWRGVLIPEEAR